MQKHLLQRSLTQHHAEMGAGLNVKIYSYKADETKDTKVGGRKHKTVSWGLLVAGKKEEWIVQVDETVGSKTGMGHKQVIFTVAGQEKFNGGLKDDFKFHQPNKGLPKNMKKEDAYEVLATSANNQWCRAKITKAAGEGKFEAAVKIPDANDPSGNSFKEITFPIVEAKNIRDAISKKPVEVPSVNVNLLVPKENPWKPQLTIENQGFENFLVVPTPKDLWTRPDQKVTVNLKVSEDRKKITSEGIGHGMLKKFHENEVFLLPNSSVDKFLCSWKIQIGPYGTHDIVLKAEKKTGGMNMDFAHGSGTCALMIDGETIVEAEPEDLFGDGKTWQVDFAFQGNTAVTCDVYKENAAGLSTGEIAKGKTVSFTDGKKGQCSHTFSIRANPKDLKQAKCLLVTDTEEKDVLNLPQWKDVGKEPDINDDLQTVEMTHSLRIPHASAEGGGLSDDMMGVMHDMFGQEGSQSLMRMFTLCSCQGAGDAVADPNTQVIVAGNQASSSAGP